MLLLEGPVNPEDSVTRGLLQAFRKMEGPSHAKRSLRLFIEVSSSRAKPRDLVLRFVARFLLVRNSETRGPSTAPAAAGSA